MLIVIFLLSVIKIDLISGASPRYVVMKKHRGGHSKKYFRRFKLVFKLIQCVNYKINNKWQSQLLKFCLKIWIFNFCCYIHSRYCSVFGFFETVLILLYAILTEIFV